MLPLLLVPMRTDVSTTGGAKNGRVKLTICKKRLKTSLWVKKNPFQFKNTTLIIKRSASLVSEADLRPYTTLDNDGLLSVINTFPAIHDRNLLNGYQEFNWSTRRYELVPCRGNSCFLQLVPRFLKTRPLKTLWLPTMMGNAHMPSSSRKQDQEIK